MNEWVKDSELCMYVCMKVYFPEAIINCVHNLPNYCTSNMCVHIKEVEKGAGKCQKPHAKQASLFYLIFFRPWSWQRSDRSIVYRPIASGKHPTSYMVTFRTACPWWDSISSISFPLPPSHLFAYICSLIFLTFQGLWSMRDQVILVPETSCHCLLVAPTRRWTRDDAKVLLIQCCLVECLENFGISHRFHEPSHHAHSIIEIFSSTLYFPSMIISQKYYRESHFLHRMSIILFTMVWLPSLDNLCLQLCPEAHCKDDRFFIYNCPHDQDKDFKMVQICLVPLDVLNPKSCTFVGQCHPVKN